MILRSFLALGLALAALAAPAAAVGEPGSGAVVEQFPFEMTFESPCTGELITVTGTQVFIIHQFTDRAGNNHLAVALALQGVSAVGESGTDYRVIAASASQQQNPPGGGPLHSGQTFQIVSQTSLDDFYLHSLFTSVSANGEEVVHHETLVSECRG